MIIPNEKLGAWVCREGAWRASAELLSSSFGSVLQLLSLILAPMQMLAIALEPAPGQGQPQGQLDS